MPETYTKEQIDEAKEWFGAFIGRKNYGLHEKYGVCLLSALSTAEQNILLHIQDHDDLMQHIAAMVDIGNRHGMGKHTEWVELIAADIGYESNTRVIPMLNDALIKASRERDALKARCAELEARMQSAGWISVEERLPDKETEACSVDCIICEEDGYQTLAYRYYGKLNEDNDNVWYDRGRRRNIAGTVTHWMPLPEPPAIVGKKEG